MRPTNGRVVRKRAPKTVYEQARTPSAPSFLTSRLDNRPHRLVPRVGRVLREMGAHAGFEIAGRPTGSALRRSSSALSAFSAAAPRLNVAKVSASVSAGGTTLATPCAVSLRSTKAMNWSEGMRVEFDALPAGQEVDLLVGRAVDAQALG